MKYNEKYDRWFTKGGNALGYKLKVNLLYITIWEHARIV